MASEREQERVKIDHYAQVYDAVYEALAVESQASIDDAIASAIDCYHADNGAEPR